MNRLDVNKEHLRVLGISGSLRRHSFNTALLRIAQEIATEGLEITIFNLKEIPLYNEDVEEMGDPQSVVALKAAIRDSDGVLFAVPEYNHSVSGVLKNAVDWASRDEGLGSLIGKPVTAMGVGGTAGTARAQLHLLNILAETGALTMAKPGFFLSNPWDRLDNDGNFMNSEDIEFLRNHISAFAEWIRLVGRPRTSLVT